MLHVTSIALVAFGQWQRKHVYAASSCTKEEQQGKRLKFIMPSLQSKSCYPRLSFVWAIQESFARSSIFLRRRGAGNWVKVTLQQTRNLLLGKNTQVCGPLDQINWKETRLCRKMVSIKNGELLISIRIFFGFYKEFIQMNKIFILSVSFFAASLQNKFKT